MEESNIDLGGDFLDSLRESLARMREDRAWLDRWKSLTDRRISCRRDLADHLEDYLADRISLKEFQTGFHLKNGPQSDTFGLGGFAGAMFLNALVKYIKDDDRLAESLRPLLAQPDDHHSAREQLNGFVSYLNGLITAGEVTRMQVKPASTPFFTSACWHMREPDSWPIYYQSARKFLSHAGVLTPTGDITEDYLAFVQTYTAMQQRLSLSSWDLESLILWIQKPQPESEICLISADPGTPSTYYDWRIQLIKTKGGWANWFSYYIKEEYQNQLHGMPFWWYHYDSGKVTYRFHCVEFVSEKKGEAQKGKGGLKSPWPEITDDELIDKTKLSRKDSEIFRCWMKFDRGERVDLTLDDFIEDQSGDRIKPVVFHNVWTFTYARRGEAEIDPEPPLPPSDPVDPINPPYPLSEFSHETGFGEPVLAGWIKGIERKGQGIFYGPPGTGKTYLAERMAKHLIAEGDGFQELVQFHPEYSYQDFIQGIRPESGPDGVLTYPLLPGRLLQFCERARGRTGRCVLIIDEINRANLSQVFGELMYLLEYRDREIPLASGETFSLPANVRIIGAMNTADRSIALVDFALRRRFAFIELPPNYEVLARFHEGAGFDPAGLISQLREINRRIGDRNFEIGPSFFLRTGLEAEMESIWTMEIEPYLEEFFFDQPDQVESYRWAKVRGKVLP